MKINYLSNKELLAEIEKSKISYCYFVSKEYEKYDVLIKNKDDILDEEKIKEYIQAKAAKLKEDPSNFTKYDLIFRFYTYDHVPDNLTKVKKNGKVVKMTRLNFNPFIHYIIDKETNDIKPVGKSHWKNGIDNGEFNLSGGNITNRLAFQIKKLVERYSQKSNWRGYSYIEDMACQAMVQLIEKVLQFDESLGSNPFAYMTSITTNSFRGYLLSENKMTDVKNKILIENGYDPNFSSQVDNMYDD